MIKSHWWVKNLMIVGCKYFNYPFKNKILSQNDLTSEFQCFMKIKVCYSKSN